MKRALMGASAAAAIALAPLCIPPAQAHADHPCVSITDPAAHQACIDESLTGLPYNGYYQPAGSPWWLLNNAWGNPPAGVQSVSYDANNFPNYSSIAWNNAGSGNEVLGYPELIYGQQNMDSPSPNGLKPSWSGQPLSALSHFIISWDIVINSTSPPTNFDILFEGFPGNHETGILMKGYPNWFGTGGWFAAGGGHGNSPVAFSNLGGISGYAIPGKWAPGSLAIVPNQAWNIAGNPWLSGTVDLIPIWQWCASQGFMSMSDTINGYEFGVEYGGGSGNITFNSISLTVS